MNRLNRLLLPVVLLASIVAVSGCKKRIAPPVPPTATAPAEVIPAPTAQITATPNVITAGDPVVLNWTTANATSAQIDGIGDVAIVVGVRTVTPPVSTTYRLIAKGPGGSAEATVRVTVNAQPVVAAPPPVNTMSAEEEFRANVKDIFFDYDKYDIRTDARATLLHDALYLVNHPNARILIGGYCDERGSEEYNLALGQNRAEAAEKLLIDDGVAASRIRLISYGKDKPFCVEHSEDCWQENRRAGFTLDR